MLLSTLLKVNGYRVNMSDYALFRLTSNSSRLGVLLQKMYKLGDTAF